MGFAVISDDNRRNDNTAAGFLIPCGVRRRVPGEPTPRTRLPDDVQLPAGRDARPEFLVQLADRARASRSRGSGLRAGRDGGPRRRCRVLEPACHDPPSSERPLSRSRPSNAALRSAPLRPISRRISCRVSPCAGAMPRCPRRPIEIDRRRRQQRRGVPVGHLDESTGRVRLWIRQHLVDGLHRRPPEIVLGVEDRAPLLAGLRREDRVELLDQRSPHSSRGRAGSHNADRRSTRDGRPPGPAAASGARLRDRRSRTTALPTRIVVDGRIAHRLAIADLDREPKRMPTARSKDSV